MRDIVVTAIVIGSLPLILRRPYVGVLMWAWVSFMSPHRLAWSFAYNMPFAMLIAVVTIIAVFMAREPRRLPINAFVLVWAAFVLWMVFTTLFAFEPTAAREQLSKVLKIQLFVLLVMLLAHSRKRIELFVWVIVLSIGFYSLKGGLFTLTTGGSSRVYGPPGGFISENNALALATLMVIPLMNFLRLQATNVWIRRGFLGAMVLSVASVLGSQSRGAFVAAAALLVFFWLKSERKLATAFVLAIVIPPLILSMPQSWVERISTINQPQAEAGDIESMRTRDLSGRLSAPIASRDRLGFWPKDFSALGRVNAWNYSINVANSRVTGAGFESWSPASFALFAPIPEEFQAAHSIFFSVLADHGWIGLTLYLAILIITWRNARWIIRQKALPPDLKWTADLARMLQLSMISYCTAGAFLSLAYYDLPWAMFAIMMLTRTLVERELATRSAPDRGARAPVFARALPAREVAPSARV